LELEKIADWLDKLGRALDYAHSEGIIHRDIKPNNIMFDRHQTPFLVDFGIVKLLDDSGADLTADGVTPGTPRYMAPEQWKNEPITPAADQYALAVVVYLMVTGSVPFDAPTAHALMYQHLDRMPAPIHRERDDAPEALSYVIQKALAKNPNDRYENLKEFAKAFAEAIRPKSMGETSSSNIRTRRGTGSNIGAPVISEILESVTTPPKESTGPMSMYNLLNAKEAQVPDEVPEPKKSTQPTEVIEPKLTLDEALRLFDDENTVGLLIANPVIGASDIELIRYLRQTPTGDRHETRTLTNFKFKVIMTTLAEHQTQLQDHEKALWIVPLLRKGRVALDKEGQLAQLQHLAQQWQPNTPAIHAHVRQTFMKVSQEMRGIIVDTMSPHMSSKPDDYYKGVTMGLVGIVAMLRTVMIDSEERYIDQMTTTIGESSQWSQWLRVALGLRTIPNLPVVQARRIALLRLYKETVPMLDGILEASQMGTVEETTWAIENVLAQYS
jgi:hypothetical protein